MVDLVKGLISLRRTLSRTKKIDIEALKGKANVDAKALLEKMPQGKDMMAVLEKIKKLTGKSTQAQVDEIIGASAKTDGKKAKRVAKADAKAGAKADAGVKAPVKSKQQEVKLVTPKSVTCPDEDEQGNEVVLVIGRDGLFGCGVLEPSD